MKVLAVQLAAVQPVLEPAQRFVGWELGKELGVLLVMLEGEVVAVVVVEMRSPLRAF
jgi:hypothetical protein